MEGHSLYGALDFLERCLRMSFGCLVDPNGSVTLSSRWEWSALVAKGEQVDTHSVAK